MAPVLSRGALLVRSTLQVVRVLLQIKLAVLLDRKPMAMPIVLVVPVLGRRLALCRGSRVGRMFVALSLSLVVPRPMVVETSRSLSIEEMVPLSACYRGASP